MSLHEQVKKVAGFADESSSQVQWSHVVFHGGELWAQGPHGGALVKTPELDLSVAVPAKKLLKALQAVGDEPELKLEDKGRLRLTGDGTARVEGMRVKDMPAFHRPPNEAEWRLVPGLSRVADLDWCVSKDATRRHLSGYHFSPEGFVEATDGHALVSLDLEAKGQPEMLVPPGVLHGLEGDQWWMAKHGGRVFIAPEKGGVSGFRVGHLIEAAFPPAQQIIVGARTQRQMVVNRAAAVALFKKAKLSNVEVCLGVSGGRLTAEVDGERQTSLFGFASSVPFRGVGPAVLEGRIGFSLAFLIPMFCSATSEEVAVYLTPSESGGLDPLMLIDGPYTGIVMPYRL